MALAAGSKLGPYEILAPLGAGGMGEVYRARDSRLNREVAVKVLPDHLAKDPQALARFEREAKAVAALSHSNILVLFDVGAQDGVTYAVTELLEGETLRERLSGSALPWRKAAEMGAAIAEGLAAAHSKSIVHRDLKPGNIFLTADGRVKILDFGLARQKAPATQNEETATLTELDAGTVTGTIGYMSPEQVRGGTAEAPSDIFSLGCVLYEMVTGRRAFAGSSANDTLAAILKEEPPAIADTGKPVPGEMERVIERCLAKNPAQRFHSAHDLAFALRSLLSVAGEKPAATPRRVPFRAAISISAATVILAVAGWLYWRDGANSSIDSLAVLPFINTGGSPDADYLSDGITESLMDSLSEVPNLKVMSRSAVFRYKGKEADPRTAGRELGVRAVLTGRITQRGDNLSVSAELVDVAENSHLWGGQYNRKLADALAVQNEIAAQISDKLRLKLSSEQKTRLAKRQTGNPDAYRLYLKGRFYASKSTQEGLDKGLQYLHQAIELDPNYALAYAGIAFTYTWNSDWVVLPAEAMPKAKEAAHKAAELDDTLAEAHVELGTVASWYEYDWAAAEREYHRGLALNPNYAPAHEFYGAQATYMGRLKEGLDQARQAEALDPLSAEICAMTAWDLYFARRFGQAGTEARKCLDLDSGYWFTYYALAQAYEQQGRFDDALEALKKAREVDDSGLTGLAEVVRNDALSGKRNEARQALEELLVRSRKEHVSDYILATVYAALGDKEQALADLERAFPERSYFLIFLKVDPELDPLRSDPRFQALVLRMNFPQ